MPMRSFVVEKIGTKRSVEWKMPDRLCPYAFKVVRGGEEVIVKDAGKIEEAMETCRRIAEKSLDCSSITRVYGDLARRFLEELDLFEELRTKGKIQLFG